MKVKTTVHTTRNYELKIPFKELLKILRAQGYPVPDQAVVSTTGGDDGTGTFGIPVPTPDDTLLMTWFDRESKTE